MSNDVKMHSDSEWVDLGSASSSPDIEFTAKLQSVGGVSLFSKEPNKGAAAADGHWDEYLLTLEGEARVENLPWLQQVTFGQCRKRDYSITPLKFPVLNPV